MAFPSLSAIGRSLYMHTVIRLPTQYGDLKFSHFEHQGQEGLVVVNESWQERPFLRIHSSCVFSESFRTTDCDCAMQLDASLKYAAENGGVVIYLYQEGRGLGLANKIRAIDLEHRLGLNTAEAFEHLGHNSDPRTYDAAVFILKTLGISEVSLGTSNPKKIYALESSGIKVAERIKLDFKKTELVESYIEKKIKHLGHEKD